MGALPDEVILLQGEMNRAMGHLHMTRVSIDAHCRKHVSDFVMAFHQNEAETTEPIREAKAHCGAAIREVEACCTTTIREVETHCTTDVREVEAHCADHAHSIRQSHSNSMQCLERETLKEEGKDCQSFLAICGVALQAYP